MHINLIMKKVNVNLVMGYYMDHIYNQAMLARKTKVEENKLYC